MERSDRAGSSDGQPNRDKLSEAHCRAAMNLRLLQMVVGSRHTTH